MADENRMITFEYARVNYDAYKLQSIPSSYECMTRSDILSYISVETTPLATYSSNQLIPRVKVIGKALAATNFDVTASNWPFTDQTGFIDHLASTHQGFLTVIEITNFSLINGRLRCNLLAKGPRLGFTMEEGITEIRGIGNIIGIQMLDISSQLMTNFNLEFSLPDSLSTIVLNSLPNFTTFNPSVPLPANLRHLSLYSLPNFEIFNPTLPLPDSVEQISINNCKLLTFYTNHQLPASLTNLYITSCDLAVFNNELPQKLETLWIGSCKLTSFNKVAPPTLTTVSLYGNLLETVYIPVINNNIKYLSVSENNLNNINNILPLPPTLDTLYIAVNNLTSLEVQLPSTLRELTLQNNKFTSFDPLYALPSSLEYLYLDSNLLTTFKPTIPLPNSLKRLQIQGNKLTKLEFTIPTNIKTLWIGSNSISDWSQSEAFFQALPQRPYPPTSEYSIVIGNNPQHIIGTPYPAIIKNKGYELSIINF